MYDIFTRLKMNAELYAMESKTPSSFMSRGEKKALKRAKEAEREFRKSKGYEPDTFWNRILYSLFKHKK